MTNSTYTPSVHLFVDMDGTLVTWKQAACFEELLQENYFRDLPPYKEVVDAINWLNSTYPEIDVHVLSAYMPENPYSVNEKNEWLDTYLPAIPKANRIFVPCGISKAEAAANVRYITHDMIELSIPDLVEKRVEGILSISYECEQEGYFETDTNAVCVDSERIHYSRETHHDTIFESKRIATNIKWDTDGEEVDLPNQMVIPDNVHDDVNAIGDYLSDETGFCHFGFGLVYEATVKVNRKDTKVINDLLSGKDLDWDADETHSINIQFRNGTNVDIMLCCPPESHANEPEGTPWTQARWYDSDEKEISCYCNDDTFFDDWAMTVENDPALSGPVSYMVHVIEE